MDTLISDYHLQKPILKCADCDRTFKKNSKLHRHQKEIHMNIKEFVCFLCNKAFKRKSHLKRHNVIHSENPKPFKCSFEDCLLNFSDKYHLERHRKLKHMNIKFICEDCNLTFEKKIFLFKHNFESHKMAKPFKCNNDLCMKSFFKESLLEKHMIHHVSSEKKKKMKLEQEEFKSMAKPHTYDPLFNIEGETVFNEKEEEQEDCFLEFINKIYKDKIENEENISFHKSNLIEFNQGFENHSPFIKHYENEINNKVSGKDEIIQTVKNDSENKNENLINNKRKKKIERIEENKPVYVCLEQNCGKNYSTMHNLKTHIRTAHLKSKDFKCFYEGCSKDFLHKKSLKEHQIKVHGIAKEEFINKNV